MDRKTNLIWVDLEMTGLNHEKEAIIEIATIVTDSHLNELATGPDLVIHVDETLLQNMDEWCTRQHTMTGLVQQVRDSKISTAMAETQTLDFLKNYVDDKASPMCGNSICTDRRFLAKYMPSLEAFFHYRMIDVSTLKELARRWAPHLVEGMKKENDHRALSDIRESIAELRHYREHFIRM